MEPTSDERSEVAERLRKTHGIMAFVDALGIDVDSDWCWTDVSSRVADLIDPTCTPEAHNYGSIVGNACPRCGWSVAGYMRYCPGCGARVVTSDGRE